MFFQLLQYKQSGGQDGDKPKENGTVPSGSPEQNGEQQQTKVKALVGNIVKTYAILIYRKKCNSFENGTKKMHIVLKGGFTLRIFFYFSYAQG